MVDLSYLEKFTKGNTTKMRRYISLYLDMAPETFDKMQQNIKDKSWRELAVNAHSLKPQAKFIGISTLKELLIEIENKVKNEQFEGMEKLFTKTKTIHDESEIFLQNFMNKG